MPATVVTGATIFIVNTERPVFDKQQIGATRTFVSRVHREVDGTAVEFRIAHHQAVGHCNAHPTVLDHVDSKPRFAGGEIAVNFQIVIDATECRFDGRRSRFRFSREQPRASARCIRSLEAQPNRQQRVRAV